MAASVAQIVNLAEARALDRTGKVHALDHLENIIKTAETRARERGTTYRGMLMPEEAWTLVQEHPSAKLIDIRSSCLLYTSRCV